MNLKTFLTIMLLIIIASIAFYIVSPKYTVLSKGNDSTFIYRLNKCTGKVKFFETHNKKFVTEELSERGNQQYYNNKGR